jgi:hypothetical protein
MQNQLYTSGLGLQTLGFVLPFEQNFARHVISLQDVRCGR